MEHPTGKGIVAQMVSVQNLMNISHPDGSCKILQSTNQFNNSRLNLFLKSEEITFKVSKHQ
jgi:hypothetical protein